MIKKLSIFLMLFFIIFGICNVKVKGATYGTSYTVTIEGVDDPMVYRVVYDIVLPDGFSYILVNIPNNNNYMSSFLNIQGGYYSSMTFYNNADVVRVYDNTYVETLITNPQTIVDYSWFDNTYANRLVFVIWQTFTVIPTDYLSYLKTYSFFDTDMIQSKVIFANGWNTYLIDTFSGKPTKPTDPVSSTGAEFNYWAFWEGEPYYFDRPITEADLNNGVLYLYARYKTGNVSVDSEIGNKPSSLTSKMIVVLSTFGLNDSTGYIFIFVMLSLLLIVALLSFKVNTLVISICEILLFGFFIYLHLLPFWVIVLVMLMLVGMFIINNKGGAEYE